MAKGVLAADQKRINRWIDKWKKRLLLEHFTLNVYFQPKPFEGDNPEDGTETQASVQFLGDYLDARIDIYPCFSYSSYDLIHKERAILHELLHIAMHSHDELAVSHMTNVIWSRK